ncbi:NAD(P)/FAD-dependent oxidoreductase [Streptomyces decoyicus]|uniref:NAD(P)/FAD-dependent oxidoreductase n=1 Tax=Streptomyces decoyicus TaxID=249567 RepID=UPI000AD4253C
MVVLGGGFAGLFDARALRRSPVAVTVVDRCAHHLFQPLLYQCASGTLSEGQIAQPLRGVLRRHHNVGCLLAEAIDVNVDARLVHAQRPEGGAVELPYDDLIVAIGMRQSYFGHPAFAAHAPGMKTLGDALDLRRRIYQAFEMTERAVDDREGTSGSPSRPSAAGRPASNSPDRSGRSPATHSTGSSGRSTRPGSGGRPLLRQPGPGRWRNVVVLGRPAHADGHRTVAGLRSVRAFPAQRCH